MSGRGFTRLQVGTGGFGVEIELFGEMKGVENVAEGGAEAEAVTDLRDGIVGDGLVG